MTATTMQWRAPMIRVTQIGSLLFDDDKPTVAFIDPSEIIGIARTRITQMAADVGDEKRFTSATHIWCRGYTIAVEETPEQVAMLRDAAFGHKSGPKAA